MLTSMTGYVLLCTPSNTHILGTCIYHYNTHIGLLGTCIYHYNIHILVFYHHYDTCNFSSLYYLLLMLQFVLVIRRYFNAISEGSSYVKIFVFKNIVCWAPPHAFIFTVLCELMNNFLHKIWKKIIFEVYKIFID